jgi:metal-dependent HD superfamily phosphatase/phosphodiesterase
VAEDEKPIFKLLKSDCTVVNYLAAAMWDVGEEVHRQMRR